MIASRKDLISLSKNLSISYNVKFTTDIFNASKNEVLLPMIKDRKIFIIIDKIVYKLHGQKIEEYFKKNKISYFLYQIKASEKDKNIATVIKICELATKFKMRRDSIFLGIGGGITLDMTGLAAFLYRRKIPYIRIPTTLAGLIDAGVGLKVGVNFLKYKNLLGGYYAPYYTFNDQLFLNTLPVKEIRNGLYEIIKMSIVKNFELFKQIEVQYQNFLNKNFNNWTNKIIHLSSLEMMRELEPNLFESNFKRLVDFGHTFSMFIEESSNFSISHGEAVGLDILISSSISLQRNILSKEDFNKIFLLAKNIGFTKKYKLDSIKKLHESLENVKAHRAGDLNLVLPSKIGKAIFTQECALKELENALIALQEFIELEKN